MKTLLRLLALVACGFAATPGGAQDALRIVAIVNDDVVSQLDLVNRLRMVILSSGLENTPEARQRLAPQVLRQLIDEQIRMQEADRLGVTVPQNRIDRRLDQIAEENNMSRPDFEALLARNGLRVDLLAEQIRIEIAWITLVQQKFRPSVVITDEDITEAQQRLLESQGKPEYQVAEIVLAVDDPAQVDAVRDAADRLLEQLKEGAEFAALARQFSQGASAERGGDLGWVQPENLSTQIGNAVERLEPGQIVGPIRSEGGFHILRLIDKRTAAAVGQGTVSLKLLTVALDAGAKPDQVNQASEAAAALRERITSCDSAVEVAAGAAAKLEDIADVAIESLPSPYQKIAMTQAIGLPSEPVRSNKGVSLLMVCARDITGNGPTRQQIADELLRERLDLLARGYMRDLRRSAFVDIRS